MRITSFFFGIWSAAFLAVLQLHAATPMPSLIFFGTLSDEFGWPYQSDVVVDVYAEGLKIMSQEITPALGRDYTFVLRVPYGSPGGADYSPDVVTPGDNVSIKIATLDRSVTLISTNFVCNLPAGSVVNFNAAAGADSLGDGLPDELRRWIWSNLGKGEAFQSYNYRGEDDSDGDGVSNLDEYLAGTDPANAADSLNVYVSKSPRADLAQLTFYSVPGKVYLIERGVFGPQGMVWTRALVGTSPDSAADQSQAVGTGHFLSVFVGVGDDVSLFRVTVPVRSGFRVLP